MLFMNTVVGTVHVGFLFTSTYLVYFNVIGKIISIFQYS